MGIEDIINKAKDAILGGADDAAAAGDKAVDAAGNTTDDLIAKAKSLVSDEQIDQIADAAKGVAPDSIDGHIDTIADHAKKLND